MNKDIAVLVVETLTQLRGEVAELKAMLAQARPVVPVVRLDMSREEVMAELGFELDKPIKFYRAAARLKLKPYRRKHYRREDVVEAVAKASFLKMKPLRRAA